MCHSCIVQTLSVLPFGLRFRVPGQQRDAGCLGRKRSSAPVNDSLDSTRDQLPAEHKPSLLAAPSQDASQQLAAGAASAAIPSSSPPQQPTGSRAQKAQKPRATILQQTATETVVEISDDVTLAIGRDADAARLVPVLEALAANQSAEDPDGPVENEPLEKQTNRRPYYGQALDARVGIAALGQGIFGEARRRCVSVTRPSERIPCTEPPGIPNRHIVAS